MVTGITAIATVFIAAFTIVLACATRRIYQHSAASERAYVQISHEDPGLTFHQVHGGVQAEITLNIKNHGRTPADICDVLLRYHIGRDSNDLPPLPCIAPPGHVKTIHFLVAGNNFFHWPPAFHISAPDFQAINTGAKTLWVYGYVEYRDKFGRRHRGGYGRRFTPNTGPNNLIVETAPGYNYDEEC